MKRKLILDPTAENCVGCMYGGSHKCQKPDGDPSCVGLDSNGRERMGKYVLKFNGMNVTRVAGRIKTDPQWRVK